MTTDPPQGPRLLLVDDTPADRALAIRALRQAFPMVQVTEITDDDTFAPALEADAFDLVVTDYQLGWSDGLRVLQRVKERAPERPVVLYTNSGNEEVAVAALKEGADDYVVKAPRKETRLALAVQGALERAALRRRERAALAARDAFLAVAAHELRTPLTALLGYAELLERRAARWDGVTARDQEALQAVVRKARELRTLADSLLDEERVRAAALTPLPRTPVDLCAAARAIVDDLAPTLERHTLRLTCAPEEVRVVGVAEQVRQVVQHLVENAVKYSPAGGPVDVEVDQQGDLARLAVHDRGIGIPPVEYARLFERFYRASNVSGDRLSGFGVGLALVQEIVTRHEGRIDVQSVEGAGSTFTVLLPLAGAAAAHGCAGEAEG